MSRTSAQQAVNNFTGGLVTEASPLKFPQNSLSKAMNVECTIEGDLRVRAPYNNVEGTADASVDETITHVKKFFWKEKNRQVIVYVHFEAYTFKVIEGNSLIASGKFSMPFPFPLEERALLNLSFWEGNIFFTVNFHDPVEDLRRASLVKAELNLATKKVIFSDFFTAEEIQTDSHREPSDGSELSYSLSSNSNTVKDFRFLAYRIEQKGPGLIGPPSTTFYYYWGPENKAFGGHIWTQKVNSYGAPWPSAPFLIGDYQYFIDDTNTLLISEVTSCQPDSEGPGDDPTTCITSRYSVAGVYRTKKMFEFKQSTGSQPIRYRDFKGVPNKSSSNIDLRLPTNTRPGATNVFNAYNLYNAGWGEADFRELVVGDKDGLTVAQAWPSAAAKTKELAGVYPSLADSRFDFLLEDTTKIEALGLYSPFQLVNNRPYMSSARRGSHILGLGYETNDGATNSNLLAYFRPDFISESSLYLSEFESYVREENKHCIVTTSEIIGGRMWHGVEGRDFNILYSQIDFENKGIEGTSVGNFANCMQVNDPTSEIANQVLHTDGGSITLKGSGRVHSFKEFRQYVLVFCENGVWAISGSGGDSFSPTGYSIMKVSSSGVTSGESSISIDNAVFYISKTALMTVSINENGILTVADVSSDKVLKEVEDFLYFYGFSFCRSLCFDERNKRIIIDYSNNPANSQYETGGPGSIQMFSSVSLVYDLRLGSFYLWDSTVLYLNQAASGYSFRTARGVPPTVSQEPSYTRQDLGFIESGDTVVKIFSDTKKTPLGSTSTSQWRLNPDAGSLLYFCSPGTGHLVDGLGEFKTSPPVCWFPVEAEIPFDILGDPTLDKSVRTMTVFQELSDKTVVGTGSDLFLPDVKLGWEWEWDSKRSGEVSISNNIQYPEHVNYSSKQVGISKTKIPGRGKSLTLRFSPAEESSTGFCILGYGIDFDASNRP